MNSTAEQRTCPNCGAAIPANAPQGVCPKCLMAAAAVSTEAGQTGARRPEPPSLERLASAFPQLDVIEFIGQGGMGAVYKARQKQLDRIVALKVLPPGTGGDPLFAERFTREAKALAKLLHPNIVALFEFGQADGIYYLLMEFVDGVSLGQLLRASRVSAREALAIVPQICDALQYAHDQGIVHRDIKPENILLDRRGRVKVADFGLAKLVEPNAPLTPSLAPSDSQWQMADGKDESAPFTGTGKIMGTPNYMAPEQVEHPGEVDHRADIYALGVVFYQMLTGELPGKRMEPPSKKVQIDVRLDEVVMRALEKDPGRRYAQASALKTKVETIATEMDRPIGSSVPAGGRDYRTRQTLFGVPLVHVTWGIDPATGRQRVAKGIVAVGPVAVGVIAVGFSAWGLMPCGIVAGGFWAVGLLAVGLEAVGLATAGLQATGLLALAFWHAVGLVAAGPSPLGLERIVVDKGIVGLLFALAIAAAWLMARLLRAIGSAADAGTAPKHSATRASSPRAPKTAGRRKLVWTVWGCLIPLLVIQLAIWSSWWARREPTGVWIPTRIDSTVSDEYGGAAVRITDVSRHGQVVLVKLVCEIPDDFPKRKLLLQYDGPVFDYPADIASMVTNVDCLVTPTYRSGGGKVLAGSREMQGAPARQIGFVLPNEMTAAKSVEQIRAVHLGKRRGLPEHSVLLVFSLHRNVGKNAKGNLVIESLSGMLQWSPD